MKNKYAFQELQENMARALIKDAEVSSKAAIETAKFLRGKSTEKAKAILQRVLEKKQAIPYTRFTDGVGHRAGAGIATGRYPQKIAKEFLRLIESAEANAQNKGLSSNLKIIHLLANKASNQFHYGRQSRRKYKRTHLEIIIEEQEEDKKTETKKDKTTKNKQTTKQKPSKSEKEKTETKPAEKKEETKQEKTEDKKPEIKEETKKEESKQEKTESPEDKK